MAQMFKETAHLNGNKKAYDEGWERIFGKKNEKHTDPNCSAGDAIGSDTEIGIAEVDPCLSDSVKKSAKPIPNSSKD